MKDRNIARLSEQQKFILVYLLDCEKFEKEYSALIRDVAEEFSEGEGDKLMNYEKLLGDGKKKKELMRNFGLDPEKNVFRFSSSTVEKKKQDPNSHVRKLLGSYPQSFSRSVKRLKDRGLVIRDPGIWGNYWDNKAEQKKYEEGEKFNSSKHTCDVCRDAKASLEIRGKWLCKECFRKVFSNRKNTTRVILTGKGKEIAEEIKRKMEDGRYNLSFDTL